MFRPALKLVSEGRIPSLTMMTALFGSTMSGAME